jgi:hypothetical protein
MNTNFLRNIGAFPAKINQIIAKEATGKAKAAFYIEFKEGLGRIVSMRLNKPLNQFDWGKTAKLMSIFKGPISAEMCQKAGEARTIKALQDLIGKDVVVLVDATEFGGKTFFQVSKVLEAKYSAFIESSASDNDPFSSGDPFGSDPLEAALDTFEGSTVKEDQDIPF